MAYLDLPHEISLALGTLNAANLGDWMCEHPQEVIDALVEAGVLHKMDVTEGTGKSLGYACYTVVQPHVHEWQVIATPDLLRRMVTIGCDCGMFYEGVPSKIPIEVPE